MSDKVRRFGRVALWALPVWAAMLFAGTVTHQPDPRVSFGDFARYVTTAEFLWSHLVNSITGAAIGSIGTVALLLYLQDTKVVGRALTGMVATIAGNTLTSSIFGAAAFAQTAMGRLFLAGKPNAPDFYDAVYGAPLFGTAVVSLLLFMIGGVATGMAITGSGRFPRWTGWVYAIMTVCFVLSNFLLPVGQSVTSALLIVATAVVAWRPSRKEEMAAVGAAH